MLQLLRDFIKRSDHNEITYEQFMNIVLYNPQKGYYMSEKEKIGTRGDFLTSSNISNVFGTLFASIFMKLINEEGIPPYICEIGGGNGRFANAVLEQLKEISQDAYDKVTYLIIETSPYHRSLQQEILPIGKKVLQYSSLAEAKVDYPGFSGIIFSNELFDAFPVRVVEKVDDDLFEVKITTNEENQLIETFSPLIAEEISSYIKEYDVQLTNGQRYEIPLAMLQYIDEMNHFLKSGVIFTVDYGYIKEEWEEPAHRRGSLRGYYQHQLIDNPLLNPGKMDLTTHIHFGSLVQYGEKRGLVFVNKMRQDEFLLKAGILTYLQDHFDTNPFSETSKQNRAIRSMIMDGGMSSAFHVVIQQKAIQIDWPNS
ncbi:class I SAM-dependent methyltransferase [Ferdinandcohnia quinoae]|uniref:SAM-dependent methyltransferase n=1 Tax=Fredinandcohnia quinoae TaxID=2918902 RepID=A0AAW5E4K4_9BACI|nr:SAM-dependent methyltransferase [Fredinandcohnia sp. SECRCQ15]MCH1624921.1 SAM-dependent methyltransferase [Fredinandcohnia sp. SECRCQ15]